MAEFYCTDCRRWNSQLVCSGCLKADPASVRWMSSYEIKRERDKAIGR